MKIEVKVTLSEDEIIEAIKDSVIPTLPMLPDNMAYGITFDSRYAYLPLSATIEAVEKPEPSVVEEPILATKEDIEEATSRC